MKKEKKQKILLAILVVAILVLFFSQVFGAITPPGDTGVEAGTTTVSKVLDLLQDIIGGPLLKPFVLFGAALAGIITWVVTSIFNFATGELSGGADRDTGFMPMPDRIIFNKLATFDPNFINPARISKEGQFSLIEIMSDVVSPLYFTGQTLVLTIFSVLALVIGIKLAIAATAQEKAQYKTAISKWVIGIFFLFAGHLFMAGVFKINETIVCTISESADSVTLPFALMSADDFNSTVDNVKQIGINLWNSISPWEALDIEAENKAHYILKKGFEGFLYYHVYTALTSLNFTSLLIWYILLGQMVALLIIYFKRMFYIIFLGIIYPFTVAADTAQKIMGKNSTLLDKWIKSFIGNVMSQTFHAFIFYFGLIIVHGVVEIVGVDTKNVENIVEHPNVTKVIKQGDTKSTVAANVASILQVVSLMSVVSMEKLIKEYTGVQTGQVGNISASALQGLAAYKTAANATKNIKDNYQGYNKARKDLAATRINKEKAIRKLTGTSIESENAAKHNRYKDYKKAVESQGGMTDRSIYRELRRQQAVEKAANMTLDKRYADAEGLNQLNIHSLENRRDKLNNDIKKAGGNIDLNIDNANVKTSGSTNITSSGDAAYTVNNANTEQAKQLARQASITEKALRDNREQIENIENEVGKRKSLASKYNTYRDEFQNTGYSIPSPMDPTDSDKDKKKAYRDAKDNLVKAIEDEKAARAEVNKKRFASVMSPGMVIAGVGVGMGAANSIDDVAKFGGVVTSALDKIVEGSAGKFSKAAVKLDVEVKTNMEKIVKETTQNITKAASSDGDVSTSALPQTTARINRDKKIK